MSWDVFLVAYVLGQMGNCDFLRGSLQPTVGGRMLGYTHLSLKMRCPCAVAHTPWYRAWSLELGLEHEYDKNMKELINRYYKH